jgi:hypothetical protein
VILTRRHGAWFNRGMVKIKLAATRPLRPSSLPGLFAVRRSLRLFGLVVAVWPHRSEDGSGWWDAEALGISVTARRS